MKKLAVLAVAAIVSITGVASTVEAKGNNHGGPVWRTNDRKAESANGHQDGNGKSDRDARGKDKDKKGDKVWRHRKRYDDRPFFLFRGRGDCDYVRARYADGTLSQKVWRVCN